MKLLTADLVNLEALTPFVYKVVLELPEAVSFAAGQYLQVVFDERDKRPFSIASCPSSPNQVELHIGAHPDNSYATEVIDRLQQTGQLEVEIPLGDAYLRSSSSKALVLLAGGTGFSYVWSMLQQQLKQEPKREIHLYWGGKTVTDLYLYGTLQELASDYQNFTFIPVVEKAEESWSGAVGLVHHALLADGLALTECDVYVAGRFEMVRVVRDDLIARGLPLDQLYGDALAYI